MRKQNKEVFFLQTGAHAQRGKRVIETQLKKSDFLQTVFVCCSFKLAKKVLEENSKTASSWPNCNLMEGKKIALLRGKKVKFNFLFIWRFNKSNYVRNAKPYNYLNKLHTIVKIFSEYES